MSFFKSKLCILWMDKHLDVAAQILHSRNLHPGAQNPGMLPFICFTHSRSLIHTAGEHRPEPVWHILHQWDLSCVIQKVTKCGNYQRKREKKKADLVEKEISTASRSADVAGGMGKVRLAAWMSYRTHSGKLYRSDGRRVSITCTRHSWTTVIQASFVTIDFTRLWKISATASSFRIESEVCSRLK